jgi:gliding motility-associated-like protein
VFANPVADFMADRYITSFKDPSFTITNLSTYPDFCAWDFGDGTTDANCNIGTHIFPGEGDYNICLVVTSIDGCKDSICKPFRVIVDEINIPNVITPNGDGANETFVIENVSKLMEHNLMIYNRWGKKVFESTNYQNDWDADNLSDGVYYYILNYKTMLGIEERVQGTVTVMRKGN